MFATSPPSTRTIRRAVGLALAALVAVLLPVNAATAAKPVPAPVYGIATHIRFDSIATPSITLPDAPGAAGLNYVVQDVAFETHLTFLDDEQNPAPFSTTRTVTLTVSYGTTALGTYDALPSDTGATVPLAAIKDPASGVELTASADIKPTRPSGTSPKFDVLIESKPINTSGQSSIGGQNGTATQCNATPDFPVCADLIPPVGGSFGDGGLLSRGVCLSGDKSCLDSYVQALATVQGGSRADPATLIMRCDKTLCGGGAIKSKRLTLTLTPGTPDVEAPDCPAKGIVGPDQAFCVDYVQSTRDNAGDTILYLLFVQDLKVRFS